MPETRAVTLANIASSDAFTVDNANDRVGIGSTVPDATLDIKNTVIVDGVAGVVTAVAFDGDGSRLTGVANTDVIVSSATTTGRLTVNNDATVSGVTTAGGVILKDGNIVAVGATLSGVLTYEDVTNVDSVGLVTARSGIEIGARPGVGASISVDGNAIFSGITTIGGASEFGGNMQMTATNPEFEMNAGGPRFRVPSSNTLSVFTSGGLGSTSNERVRIDSSGGVHIATSSGNEKLNVHGAIRASGSSANFNAGLEGALVDYDTSNNIARFGHVNGASGSARSVTFLSGGTERLRIGSAGQLGIGGANYGTSGQFLQSQGASSAVQWATPSSITTAGGTMTLGFRDHVSNSVSSTTPTAYYQRIGNMVFCSCDTGAINLSGLNNGQILLVTGCFPVTRDNNWDMCGSAYQYTVNSAQNGGGPVIVPTMGYWLSNTSLYFVIPRNNSTADNMTVGMCNSNNTRIFMQWHYKVN